MRKLILTTATLIFAASALVAVVCPPAIAGITIIASDLGSGVCQVRYTMDGGDVNIPRAFALDVTMNPANGTTLAPYDFDPNFYVAPGTFTYDPCTGNTNWGNPVIGPNTVKFTIEMGSLWDPCDVNHPMQPKSSGTLFKFAVDKCCTISLAQNAARGGVVMEDTSKTFPPGYVTLVGAASCPCIIVVPNVIGMNRIDARAALIAAGFVFNEMNAPPTVTCTTLRTVCGQNPPPGCSPYPGPGSVVDINVVSYPIKTMTVAGSLYVNWVNRGRPACWAYPRQCRGDADGRKAGLYWCGENDLTILRAAINKAESALPPVGICADFDHQKAGLYWVGQNDLARFRACISRLESAVPPCGNTNPNMPPPDPNYLYWCVPTGVACPVTQVCAPAGICPNSL
jgi:hypothetical protein